MRRKRSGHGPKGRGGDPKIVSNRFDESPQAFSSVLIAHAMTCARLSVAIRASACRAEPLARVCPPAVRRRRYGEGAGAWPAEAVVARPDRLA